MKIAKGKLVKENIQHKVSHSHTKIGGRLKNKSGKIIYIHNKQLRDS